MNTIPDSWEHNWELIGWTVCYFLAWGTGIAIVGAALRRLCHRTAPSLRYATSLAVFVALAVSPLGIAGYLAQSPRSELAPIGPSSPSTAPSTAVADEQAAIEKSLSKEPAALETEKGEAEAPVEIVFEPGKTMV